MEIPGIEQYRKRIIVVYSPGGGNGKSEIAANLAFSLAKKGLRTWVLDANLFAPTQDTIFMVQSLGPNFSDYIINPTEKDFPLCDISSGFPEHIHLFLTSSNTDDSTTRFQVKERLNSNSELDSTIPEAVLTTMKEHDIDVLIIDTHPSFETINEIWLGMTEFLLIVTRMNDLDLKNLRRLLKEGNVEDIQQKLIVFNNVRLDKNRRPLEAIENREVVERLLNDQRRKELAEYLTGRRISLHDKETGVTIFKSAFLYSEKLAMFGDCSPRDGLFIQKEPTDSFSRGIEDLSNALLLSTFGKS